MFGQDAQRSGLLASVAEQQQGIEGHQGELEGARPLETQREQVLLDELQSAA